MESSRASLPPSGIPQKWGKTRREKRRGEGGRKERYRHEREEEGKKLVESKVKGRRQEGGKKQWPLSGLAEK